MGNWDRAWPVMTSLAGWSLAPGGVLGGVGPGQELGNAATVGRSAWGANSGADVSVTRRVLQRDRVGES